MNTRRITARMRSGKKVILPAWELDGSADGPRLLVLAAQHGNEVQGSEAIRQFVDIAARGKLDGKVFAVPFANLPAIRERRPHIQMRPEQAYGDDRGHNMNRTWPGNPRGNDTARLSSAIYRAFGDRATHCLDFHCWEKHGAPALLMREAPGLRATVRNIGHRFVRVSEGRNTTLADHFCSTGRVGFTYEFSGQYIVDREQVRLGLRVLTNFAKLIGLIPGPLEKGHSPVLFSDQTESKDVVAPCSGLFVPADRQLCQHVSKKEVLGHILSDVTLQRREIEAPHAGYLRAFGARRAKADVAVTGHHPYVSRGECLATIVWAKTMDPSRTREG